MTASPTVNVPTDAAASRVFRVEVRPRQGEIDPAGQRVLAEARAALGEVAAVHVARVYLFEAALSEAQVQQIADELLADRVNQTATLGAADSVAGAMVEVHYQPGVMDPVAQSTRDAILEMLPDAGEGLAVRTGFRYDFEMAEGADLPGEEALQQFAQRELANTVIQDVYVQPFFPDAFPHGHAYEFKLVHVAIRDLDDDGLMKLSREGHLFLSLEEMQRVRDYYRAADREPTDIELETLAQTWSEHCVHKTLKSTVRQRRARIRWRSSATSPATRSTKTARSPSITC